jgi:hypothetical protein
VNARQANFQSAILQDFFAKSRKGSNDPNPEGAWAFNIRDKVVSM